MLFSIHHWKGGEEVAVETVEIKNIEERLEHELSTITEIKKRVVDNMIDEILRINLRLKSLDEEIIENATVNETKAIKAYINRTLSPLKRMTVQYLDKLSNHKEKIKNEK